MLVVIAQCEFSVVPFNSSVICSLSVCSHLLLFRWMVVVYHFVASSTDVICWLKSTKSHNTARTTTLKWWPEGKRTNGGIKKQTQIVWRQVTRTARNIYYSCHGIFLSSCFSPSFCVARLQSAHTPYTRQYAKWFRLEQTVFTFCVKFIYLTIEKKNVWISRRVLLCLLRVCCACA